MELEVKNISGSSTGRTVSLPEKIFGVEPNDHAIYLAVKQYLANQRQGTHKAKERGEIKGSTRKIKRQKGTGTARAGSIKNPLFRGGGRVFGPKPRNYRFKLNKKVKEMARKSALSYKAQQDHIIVVEDFKLDNPKTKEYVGILKNLGLDNKKSILVLDEYQENLHLALRNLKTAGIATASSLSTYRILNSNVLIMTESAVNTFSE